MKFFLTLFALLLCFLCSNSLTTRLHRLSNSRSTSTALYIGRLDSIPVDISSVDSIVSSVSATSDLLVPDTSIIPLDGGFNLGTLLWGFSLYYGFFPDQRSPADWLLVFLGNATNSLDKEDSNNQWYQDFLDGYLYDVPPPLFFLQVGIFAGLGYIANSLWIQQFDGDIFWGWSTGLSLSLPVGLLALSKDRLLSRSEATSQNELKDQFRAFRLRRLGKVPGKRASEELVLQALQRETLAVVMEQRRKMSIEDREKDEMSRVKFQRRLLRGWVGYKPDRDGNFANIELRPVDSGNSISSNSGVAVTTSDVTKKSVSS